MKRKVKTKKPRAKPDIPRAFSEATRLKMSQAAKGRKHSQATKDKIRFALLGRVFRSPETRSKMSWAHRGKTQTEETKEKIRFALLGSKREKVQP